MAKSKSSSSPSISSAAASAVIPNVLAERYASAALRGDESRLMAERVLREYC